MSDPFYRAFEDRHRGSRENIQARQETYLPFLRALREHEGAPALIDIGCGRGEWLELARAEGWHVQGVDLDDAMLAACREAGLDVRQGDAVQYLRELPDASANVVSGFHVAEHLPFDELRRLVEQALRVLRPGGLLILETPNPENLVMGSSSFYMDPTHVKPLPPALLAFLAQYAGFARVATLRLHEGIASDAPVELIDVLAGVSPDYSIIALKPDADSSPALDELLATRHGVTLNELAQRYDRRLDARLHELETTLELAREAATQFAASRREILTRMQAFERAHIVTPKLESHAVDRMLDMQDATLRLQGHIAGLHGEIASLHGHVRAMEASTSWRLTAPLRWAGAQRLEIARFASESLRRVPFVRGPLRNLARALRIVPRRPQADAHAPPTPTLAPQPAGSPAPMPSPAPAPTPAPIPDPASLSADARRMNELMVHARGGATPGKEN